MSWQPGPQQVPPPLWSGSPDPGGWPPPRRRKHPRLVWVIAAAVVAIAAAVTVPTVFGAHTPLTRPAPTGARSSSAAPSADQPDPSIFLTTDPGTSGSAPLRWGGTPMYDACTLLPMSAVIRQGIHLDPAYAAFVDRPDPNNSGGPGATQPNVAGDSASDCFWPGVNLKSTVSLTMYQKPFNSDQDIQQAIYDGQNGTQRTDHGFDIYTTNDTTETDRWNVVVTNQQLAAQLDLQLPPGSFTGTVQSVVAALTNTIVTGLAQPPGPAVRIAYRGRYAGVDPCSAFTAQDFARYMQTPDDGHPHAEYQLGERVVDPDPGSQQPIQNYISTQCQRFSVALDNGDSTAPGIIAGFETYRTAAEARAGIAGWCDPPNSAAAPYGPPIPEHVTVGDGLVCYPRLKAGDWALYFLSGRTVASVWLWQTIDESKLPQLTPIITPLAQALAARIKTM